jgi:hypothetical protein
MWVLELVLILIVAYVAWRLHRLELQIEAMERLYNELADMFDREFGDG